ncbi:MAG: hypothetical protein D5R97_04075 [Candidatus Syntrophonatronum acetioxidans]|uniref:Cell wall-binding repeat-containing protein n=1 Tax=Candidatus Syntrophonatronum acetioxidans TaxID=1795816 RepID=A0A424YFX5_9FIRM|nr:MAG: hypothetical protein D5R97_04075 [Candidatus Syntrophonatronum acetioxidans]
MARNQKYLITALCGLLLVTGFFLGQAGQATSTSQAGTSRDPLVTESYLEERLKDLKAEAEEPGEGVEFDGKTVIIATGEEPYDAQAAAPLASSRGAVLLLTPSSRLSSSARETLEVLEPEEIFLMGGEVALSSQVENDIGEVSPQAALKRIQGADRYETAAEIVRETTGLSW